MLCAMAEVGESSGAKSPQEIWAKLGISLSLTLFLFRFFSLVLVLILPVWIQPTKLKCNYQTQMEKKKMTTFFFPFNGLHNVVERLHLVFSFWEPSKGLWVILFVTTNCPLACHKYLWFRRLDFSFLFLVPLT